MIHIECSWCDADVVLESLDANRVDCPECLVSVEFAADTETLALAA